MIGDAEPYRLSDADRAEWDAIYREQGWRVLASLGRFGLRGVEAEDVAMNGWVAALEAGDAPHGSWATRSARFAALHHLRERETEARNLAEFAHTGWRSARQCAADPECEGMVLGHGGGCGRGLCAKHYRRWLRARKEEAQA